MRSSWKTARSAGLMVLALLLSACTVSRDLVRATPPADPAVRAQITASLAQWSDAASRGDLAGFMAQFDGSGDIMLIGSDRGEVFKGRAEIEDWLQKLFVSNRFGWEMERVDIDHHGDIAWAFVEGQMVIRDLQGKIKGKTPYRFVAILAKTPQGWKWKTFSGSIPAGEG